MAESKKVIPKQLQCSTQEVQYAEAAIEESPDLRKKYEDIINTYIKKGYAKNLSIEEACKVSEKTWYQTHHPVFNRNKSDKFLMQLLNITVSLDKALLNGLDLLKRLVGVLLWVHNYRVTFSTDTEAMYHQVQVNSDDDLRFL